MKDADESLEPAEWVAKKRRTESRYMIALPVLALVVAIPVAVVIYQVDRHTGSASHSSTRAAELLTEVMGSDEPRAAYDALSQQDRDALDRLAKPPGNLEGWPAYSTIVEDIGDIWRDPPLSLTRGGVGRVVCQQRALTTHHEGRSTAY